MAVRTDARSSNFLKNWWGYTNYFLNQKPWLKYALIAGSAMVGAYIAWPLGLTFKAISLFGVSSLMSHFLSYAVVGSLNLSAQLFKTFSLLKAYLDNSASEEEANFQGLFDQLFNHPEQIYSSLTAQLEQSIDARFKSWASNYQGNKVPNEYETELNSFLEEAVAIEVDAFMPHVNYVFDILSLHYQNQGHQAESPIFGQMQKLHSAIKDTFKMKFLEGIYHHFKARLMMPEYEQIFFQNALNAMIRKQLNGRDPLSILELKDHSNPTPELIGQQFKKLIMKNRSGVLHGNASDVDSQKMVHARDIAIAQIKRKQLA